MRSEMNIFDSVRGLVIGRGEKFRNRPGPAQLVVGAGFDGVGLVAVLVQVGVVHLQVEGPVTGGEVLGIQFMPNVKVHTLVVRPVAQVNLDLRGRIRFFQSDRVMISNHGRVHPTDVVFVDEAAGAALLVIGIRY